MTFSPSAAGSTVLEEIEALRQLKARYFRTLDTKDWAGFRRVFADDVVMDTTDSGGSIVSGADEFITFLRKILGDQPTVHHGHTSEIALTSATSATGIWAMEDLVRFPDGTELRGYGHYHDVYEKAGTEWRIKSSKLTRLRQDFVPALVSDS